MLDGRGRIGIPPSGPTWLLVRHRQRAKRAYHHVPVTRTQRLSIALALNGLLVVGQVVFGLLANSMGLLADAAHNLSDIAALVMAVMGVLLSRRPPTPERSYGWHRATILAALGNGLLLIAVTGIIMVEAILRLAHPEPVKGGVVVIVAAAATGLNAAAALVLRERQSDLNMRAALLHMSADAAASLGVAAVGLVILSTGRFDWLDPAVSIAIGLVIGVEAWRLVRRAVDVLLEATPPDIDLTSLAAAMTDVDGVADVHDIHVWSLSSGVRVLTAHVVIRDAQSLAGAQVIGGEVKHAIEHLFGIAHTTIELEDDGCELDCLPDTERHIRD